MFEKYAPNFKFRTISESTKKVLRLFKKKQNIEELIANLDINKGLALFGCGSVGRCAYAALIRKNIIPDCLIDNDPAKWGNHFKGIPIISVSDFRTVSKKMNLLISMAEYYPVVEQLDNMDLLDCIKGYLITIDPESDIINNISDTFGLSTLCNTEKSLNDNTPYIEKVFSILEDEKSKNTFYGIINYHLTKDANYIYAIAEYGEHIYFDSEIIKLSEKECFIDGGAFDGTDTKMFINITDNKFRKILLFEPQKNCRQIIESNLPIATDTRICLYNFGLYDRETKIHFSNSIQGSTIDSIGPETICTTILDKYSIDKPTFIKMDIEGAELAALRGGGRIITQLKPKLAICIYHKPFDLWEIPLYIKEIVPGYKIYIRHYFCNSTDTVCYAV